MDGLKQIFYTPKLALSSLFINECSKRRLVISALTLCSIVIVIAIYKVIKIVKEKVLSSIKSELDQTKDQLDKARSDLVANQVMSNTIFADLERAKNQEISLLHYELDQTKEQFNSLKSEFEDKLIDLDNQKNEDIKKLSDKIRQLEAKNKKDTNPLYSSLLADENNLNEGDLRTTIGFRKKIKNAFSIKRPFKKEKVNKTTFVDKLKRILNI